MPEEYMNRFGRWHHLYYIYSLSIYQLYIQTLM